VLIERTQRRLADPSDATADVVRMQLTQDTGAIGWRRIDASAPADVMLRDALSCLPAGTRGG
jgi:predicted kinase